MAQAVEGEHDGRAARLGEFGPEGGEDGPGGFRVDDAGFEEVLDGGPGGERLGEGGGGGEGEGEEVFVGFEELREEVRGVGVLGVLGGR